MLQMGWRRSGKRREETPSCPGLTMMVGWEADPTRSDGAPKSLALFSCSLKPTVSQAGSVSRSLGASPHFDKRNWVSS